MSEFELFSMENPWALDIIKSDILMRFLIFVSVERSYDEVRELFSFLDDKTVERMAKDMEALGLVKSGEKIELTPLGHKFLAACRSVFES